MHAHVMVTFEVIKSKSNLLYSLEANKSYKSINNKPACWNELESVNKNNSVPYGLNRNGMSSMRILTHCEFLYTRINTPLDCIDEIWRQAVFSAFAFGRIARRHSIHVYINQYCQQEIT